jgi:hypothetical protein
MCIFVFLLWRDWRGKKPNSYNEQRISIKLPTLLLRRQMKLLRERYSVHHLPPHNLSALSPGDSNYEDAGEDDGGAGDAQGAEFFAEPEPTCEGGKDDADLAHGTGVVDL